MSYEQVLNCLSIITTMKIVSLKFIGKSVQVYLTLNSYPSG